MSVAAPPCGRTISYASTGLVRGGRSAGEDGDGTYGTDQDPHEGEKRRAFRFPYLTAAQRVKKGDGESLLILEEHLSW